MLTLALVITMMAAEGPAVQDPGQVRQDLALAAVKRGELRYYPEKAQLRGVKGRVTLDCLVETGGWLSDCKVAGESPGGWGFGDTALAMAPLFRSKPVQLGGPAVGSRTRIPIRFEPPQ
jgi:TonB family protein